MRILLAEDEKELSKALCTIFKHNNYSIDSVFNGQDAIDYLRTELYDIAILDIMMPKMNGIEVLSLARKEGIKIPILMLTAKSEIDDKVLGLDNGADDYLTKPFVMKELLARVRALTRRNTESSQNILTCYDLSLNRETYELSSKNSSFKLSSKEFQMIEMLMSHPGNVISTERFMEKIWGYDTESEQNIVWVYISYLRKKFEQIGTTAQIKVKRGIGYSLEQ